MVKGLKVLRQRRTEAGYFSEFLIAKTPDDVENCLPLPLPPAPQPPPLPPPARAADSGSGMASFADFQTFQQQQQQQAFQHSSVYAGSAYDFVVGGDDVSPPDWPHQHPQHHLTLSLSFGHSEPEHRVVTLHRQQLPASATTEIARQEVVAASSAATACASAARHRHQPPPDMAAGMSKMKINLGSNRRPATSDAQPRPPTSATRRPPASPSPPASASSSPPPAPATAASAESQRRRRERNRAAAARCRRKRQDQLDGLSEAVRDLEAENASLESRVAALSAARSDLLRRLREHRLTCPDGTQFAPDAFCDLGITLDTNLASLATAPSAGDVEEILLTPSLLLPPPLPSPQPSGSGGADFKLEPL